MARFRERLNSATAEISTIREFSGGSELLAIVREILAPWGVPVKDASLSATPHNPNDRLGWNQHIVHIKGYGVIGYTDGPIDGVKEYPSRPSYLAYEDQLPPERLTPSP